MPPVGSRTGPLDPATADGVRALAAAARAQDGVPPLSEQPLLWLQSDGSAGIMHLLVREDASASGAASPSESTPAVHGSGPVVAYGQLDLRDPGHVSAELVVHPDRRRRGLGTALLSAARTSVAASGRTTAPARPTTSAGGAGAGGSPVLSVWAHGDLPVARAFAAGHGLPVVRELWQMRRPLDRTSLPPAPVLRDGVTTRAFVPGRDEDAWLRLNARAFPHHPEQGRLTRLDLQDRMAEPWFDPTGLLLVEQDGVLLAAGWTKVPPGDETGEIYVLGVDPTAQGQGLGHALTALMLRQLANRGLHEVLLYTEGDNAPAVAVYRAAGFERSAVDVAFGA